MGRDKQLIFIPTPNLHKTPPPTPPEQIKFPRLLLIEFFQKLKVPPPLRNFGPDLLWPRTDRDQKSPGHSIRAIYSHADWHLSIIMMACVIFHKFLPRFISSESTRKQTTCIFSYFTFYVYVL